MLVVTVSESDLDARDTGDAANVARSRLLPATVDVLEREGEPSEAIRAVLAERDTDVLVLGPRHGDPDAGGETGTDAGDADSVGPGSTVRALLGTVDVPVVVVPLPDL